jgi:3' terminal RNA ribose 2'-O-methyltransferase Hen1
MLLTISTSRRPATDLGWLLHKHPERVQTFDLSFGKAHVFYPVATEHRCSIALLLDVDPISLVRGRGPAGEGGLLDQYVNDRPYVASSFMSVAISRVFGSALSGKSVDRPELVEEAMPFAARIAALPCRGGERFLRKLFEPLGYAVTAEGDVLDPKFPDWGQAPYFTVTLAKTCRLRDLLSHLYVLIPVLDDDKHYWVSRDEGEKLLRHGDGWLADHPEKEQIVERYMKHQRRLAREIIARLADDGGEDPDEQDEKHEREEKGLEETIRLNDERIGAVVAALKASGARRILDLGCGEGRLIKTLLPDKSIEEIVGLDVSHRTLQIASERLHMDEMPEAQRKRVRLLHGSLMYRDARLAGFDAAAVVEVVEHLNPPRLAAFERVVFEFARPRTVVITTPNVEYNVKFEGLIAGKFRHKDHRFEWRRDEFEKWARAIAERFRYEVRFLPVGPVDSAVGSPTQMGVFSCA